MTEHHDGRDHPLQNRVRPDGTIVAVPQRGAWMGNRGGPIHDETGRIVRVQAGRAWLICRLEFKGRQRRVMAPNHYTELFFLDEVTALAAGHRPCMECRRDDATEFRDHFRHTTGRPRAGMRDLDGVLSSQRHRRWARMGNDKVTFDARVALLPPGTMVAVDGSPHLVVTDPADGSPRLRQWSFDGYGPATDVPADPVTVLTPAVTVDILAAGHRPQVHPSAT